MKNSKIKVSDYIAERLKEHSVEQIFMLTGGGAMHLNNSLGKMFNYICFHHEQGCAIAAEGYARVTGKMPVVNVTTGPGGLNTLTGVMGQWTDSVPVLYISGQVKYTTTIDSCKELNLRQLGDQEVDIISVVKSLTKYSILVDDPNSIKYHLDRAIYIATHGRPGPVWIDVPVDIQAAIIDKDNLVEYNSEMDSIKTDNLNTKIKDVYNKLGDSSYPLIVAGNGITISNGRDDFLDLVDKLKIPVVTTFNGFDLIEENNPYYAGRIGNQGTRSGNFALQNCDLLITIGTRNNVRQVSYNWENFAKYAYKIIVDIDEKELLKKTVTPDLPVIADAKEFINSLISISNDFNSNKYKEWVRHCFNLKIKYPVVLPEYKNNDTINPYYFIDILTEKCESADTIVAGNGTASVALMQAAKVKKGQRMFANSGCAAMGYDLPAAIGAAFGIETGQVICIAGDGSFQLNIQELQTVVYHKLPIKIFYLNNSGYSSIRQTQDNFFNGERVGCDENSKVSFPSMEKVIKAFGMQYVKLEHSDKIAERLSEILKLDGPLFCEVILSTDYIFIPKVSSKKLPDGSMVSTSLEDMFPFLEPEELKSNMIKRK